MMKGYIVAGERILQAAHGKSLYRQLKERALHTFIFMR
jgi:hypothetical protein